jgi:uncharacterized protein (DUF169 family)
VLPSKLGKFIEIGRIHLHFVERMHKAIVFGRLACRARQFHSSRYAAKLVVEKVPALGESITEGSIASWTKAVGDRVAVDDVIVIVETDKVTVDIKSTYAGVLTRKIATDTVSTHSTTSSVCQSLC